MMVPWRERTSCAELSVGAWIIGRKPTPVTWRRSTFAAALGEHLGFPGFWRLD